MDDGKGIKSSSGIEKIDLRWIHDTIYMQMNLQTDKRCSLLYAHTYSHNKRLHTHTDTHTHTHTSNHWFYGSKHVIRIPSPKTISSYKLLLFSTFNYNLLMDLWCTYITLVDNVYIFSLLFFSFLVPFLMSFSFALSFVFFLFELKVANV